jgi:hypothetical protein
MAMKDLRITRRRILTGAGAVGVLGALGVPTAGFAQDEGGGRRVRWDLVLIGSGCVSPGGTARARSNDQSELTLTGSGTFPDVRNRCDKRVTGGGTWSIAPPEEGTECFTGSGTYRVTELLSWIPNTAGSVANTPLSDCIGEAEDSTAGLAKLRVRYSNAHGVLAHGVLTVSCGLPKAPECIFEGITASMDWEDFWNREHPVDDMNRTVFHFLHRKED